MSAPDLDLKIVARLKLKEDGSISNARVEQYALLLAEEVLPPTTAWIICMATRREAKIDPATGKKKRPSLPSNNYKRNIHQSPAFRIRCEQLFTEKYKLMEDGDVGQLIWQIKQNYRRAVARDDLRMMDKATDQLMRIVLPTLKPAPADKPEGGVPRGKGAPSTDELHPEPEEEDVFGARLLQRQ